MVDSGASNDGKFAYESAPYRKGWQDDLSPDPHGSGPTAAMAESLRTVQRDIDAAGITGVELA